MGDYVRVFNGRKGIIIRITYSTKQMNWLHRLLAKRERQLYAVAHYNIGSGLGIVEYYERNELEPWSKREEREEKLKSIGI